MAEKKKKTALGDFAVNRKAYHDYTVLEKLECGIELAGTEVKVEIPFEAVDLMDNLDDGIIDGEVHFILYMGDHYHLTIKTDDGDFLWVDTNDIWDKGDLVGIRLNPENSKKEIKITKKDEQAQ